ncbi:MAG: hypothetical protein M1828_002818 [Chrysothrix sp. TS-e1954]|nr:MAG: hypothetical protein M1828_002818 [Chrysothrix sp. TS-e1954]
MPVTSRSLPIVPSFISDHQSSRSPNRRNYASQNFASISKCPSPECRCDPTPGGLDIDATTPLAGKCPIYDQHIVILTGRADWPSRIEDDDCKLIGKVKKALQPGGSCYHPDRRPLLSASSQSPVDSTPWLSGIAIYRPFARILGCPGMAPGEHGIVHDKETIEKCEDSLIDSLKDALDINNAGRESDVHPDRKGGESASVLICGHNARDSRCGILGPLLEVQLHNVLAKKGITGHTLVMPDADHPNLSKPFYEGHVKVSELQSFPTRTVSHGLISHIGGHKFAGNLIVNIPPKWVYNTALEGCSIWYGRVEPRHVEGIVQKTLMDGVIIEELFRGGMDKHGKPMAL